MKNPNAPGTRLKVLHVCRILDRELTGGIHTYLECVKHALAEVSVDMHVAATWYGHEKDFLVQCDYAPRQRAGRLRSALAFQRWLAAHVAEYDVVHLHGIYWTLVPAMVCRNAGVPYVVNPHGSLLPWELNNAGWHWLMFRYSFGRALLRDAQAVIATSQLDAKANSDFEPRMPVRVISPATAVAASMQAKHSSDGQTLRMVTIGRVESVKRIPFLIQTLAELRDREILAELHIVGSGAQEYQQELNELVGRLGLAQCVHWHGYLTGQALAQQLALSDVFVLGSLWENFSFATAEAMAQAVPVIVSDGVGLAELVRKCDAGDVVPMKNPVDTADTLVRYLQQEYRQRRARAAYQAAREHLSHEAMGQGLLACYQAAVAGVARA